MILRLKAFPAKGGVNVQAGITGHAHMGLSVYQDGARIPLRYRLEGRDGAQVAAGVLTYG